MMTYIERMRQITNAHEAGEIVDAEDIAFLLQRIEELEEEIGDLENQNAGLENENGALYEQIEEMDGE